MSVQSFNAICNEHTHTMVLGSMPGVASLDAHQYYAHKRNSFWPIMLAFINQSKPDYGVHEKLSYPDKVASLQAAGFGLWDVLAECERVGSLDSAIKSNSVIMNDFPALFIRYANISTVAFNGKTAERLFLRHAMPKLKDAQFDVDSIRWVCLPSSSPAMASLSLTQKYQQWTTLLKEDSSTSQGTPET